MERQSLLILLFLSCSAIQLVSSQPTAVVVNNEQQQEQPQQEQQQQQGESISSSGGDSSGSEEVGGSDVEIPVVESTEEGGHSMTGCQALCDESCDNTPEECEFIDEAVPVMCGNDAEECKAGCEKFCACEFACGCNVAEGCDDPCSAECQSNFKPIQPVAVSTPEGAMASGEVKNDNGATGLPVVYKKVDEEEMED